MRSQRLQGNEFASVFPRFGESRFRISTLNATSRVTLEMSQKGRTEDRKEKKKKKKGRDTRNEKFFFFSLCPQTELPLLCPGAYLSLLCSGWTVSRPREIGESLRKNVRRPIVGLGSEKRKLKPHESIVGCVTGGLFLPLCPPLFSLLSPWAAEASCIISKFMASAVPGPYTLSEYNTTDELLLFSTFHLPSLFHPPSPWTLANLTLKNWINITNQYNYITTMMNDELCIRQKKKKNKWKSFLNRSVISFNFFSV